MALPTKITSLNEISGIDTFYNGGKGSGNFGHLGRPGEVGGSASTLGSGKGAGDSGKSEDGQPDVTKHIANTAQTNIAKASKEEPETTKDLADVLKKNGSQFSGLKFRLKTNESLARKIATDLESEGLKSTNENIQKIANSIHDNLRYTAICDPKTYVKQYEGIVKDLESKGYEVVKAKNTFADPNSSYKGLNTQVRNKNGYIFELQFHTKQSVIIKEEMHKLYDISRDPKQSKAAREKADAKMWELSKKVILPDNVDDIKSFNKLK